MTLQRQAAASLILYAMLTLVAYSLLSVVFHFPDILREPIADRFTLFQDNARVIVPTYYAFALTGLLQITFSVLLFSLFNPTRPNALLALVFGVLSGLTQMLGYLRWVAAVPFLAGQSAVADMSIFEGVLNTYLGMTVGEHLGNLFLAAWLWNLRSVLVSVQTLDSRLSAMAGIAGVLMLAVAFEPLGGPFSVLSPLTLPVWGLVVTWMLLLAYALFRRRDANPRLPNWAWVAALLFWLVNVVPAFI